MRGDGTARDVTTGLLWSKEGPSSVTWEQAKGYCEKLGEGWRLPTVDELRGVVDTSVSWGPKTQLPGTYEWAWYWSSEQSYRGENVGPDRAFYAFFTIGIVNHLDVGYRNGVTRARCVRQGDGVD